MNDFTDKILLTLNLTNPYKNNLDKMKETVEFLIEDLQISDYHKANMKIIVQQSKTIEDIVNLLGNYIYMNSMNI